VHPARPKSSNTVLLSTVIIKDFPLLRFISVNWLVPTAVTWPSTSSRSLHLLVFVRISSVDHLGDGHGRIDGEVILNRSVHVEVEF